MKRDKITGRMLPTPPGEKFPSIIKREKELSFHENREILFEEDYHNLLLSGKMGVNDFCKRWNQNKGWILYQGRSSAKRCWVDHLGLPRHNLSMDEVVHSNLTSIKKKISECQICGTSETILDFCHWIPKKDGGPKKYHNGFKGCPNCNRRLDCIVFPHIAQGVATENDLIFYEKCKKVIIDFIDKEYDDDPEIRKYYKRRVEVRSMLLKINYDGY